MVPHTSSNSSLKAEEVETRFGPSVKRKHMSRPRKRINCGEGRDFFRLAAAFANAEQRESDFGQQIAKAPRDVVVELGYSKYLQARYQERSVLFVAASPQALPYEATPFGYTLIEKWRRAFGYGNPRVDDMVRECADSGAFIVDTSARAPCHKNDVNFSAQELACLASVARNLIRKAYRATNSVMHMPALSAPEFHQNLKRLINDERRHPFLCVVNTPEEVRLAVEHARIFWSHRLQKKSMQASNSAEPSICYFHAALRSAEAIDIDILYWLKHDEEKVVLSGDYIQLENGNPKPCELVTSDAILQDHERLTTYLTAFDMPTRRFVEDVGRLLLH